MRKFVSRVFGPKVWGKMLAPKLFPKADQEALRQRFIEVLVQHAAVREAAVFGIPSEKWGEVPVGAVVLKSVSTVTAEQVRVWANARVAARYQQLAEIVILEDFPRSSAGKTLKRTLREPYWAGHATKI